MENRFMMTKHVSLIALLLVAACGKPTDTESSRAALKYPVSDGGACAIGETGCNGLGNALYACVEDQTGQSHWGSPTLCPLGCVSVAPASNGLENDICHECVPGSSRIVSVNDRCVVQTCNPAEAWGPGRPMRCLPGGVLDESTCTCSCINPKCQQGN
jgi:hypothetical protein